MKKKMVVGILSTVLTLTMGMTAFAGQWQSDANGWWYQNDDGSYLVNTWQWIDGNNDGIAESYCFNQQGYCLMNTVTPDGYTVNPAGAWIVDGVVQIQTVEYTTKNETNNPNSNITAVNLLDLKPVGGALNKFSNKRTNKKELWSEGFRVSFNEYSVASNGYAEFLAGGQYTTFTATIALPDDIGEYASGCLEVYGDNDTLLYSSNDMDYKSDALSIRVDITGQQYIKLVGAGSGNGHTYHGSNSFPILIKNAQFK